MQSDRKDLDEFFDELQQPLTEDSPVSMRVMQAVLAARAQKREGEEKQELNVRTLDITDLDRKLTAGFFDALRNPQKINEVLTLVVKDGAHFFIAAIEYSQDGPQFALLDAAGDLRGASFADKLASLQRNDGTHYFRQGFIAAGDRHEDAQSDLESWFPQKDHKSCPGFTADHAFKLSKMHHFFRDLEKHTSKDNITSKAGRPAVHFVNWIYLAKKLVQRAQSERWRKEFNRLHPGLDTQKNVLPVEDHFIKIQNEACNMLDNFVENGKSYDEIIRDISAVVGLSPDQLELLAKPEDLQVAEKIEIDYTNFEDVRSQLADATDTVMLGQAMKLLSPADCKRVFEEMPDKVELVESLYEYSPCLIVDLNAEQRQATCSAMLEHLSTIADNAYALSIFMTDCPREKQADFFAMMKPGMKDWYTGNLDMVEFQEVASVISSRMLTEFCSVFKDVIKPFVGENHKESLKDFSAEQQKAIIAGLSPAPKFSQTGSMFSARKAPAEAPRKTEEDTPKPGKNN